ncbi:MAG: DUF4410 domain-containing protein [Methylophilaceae bacterium]
MKMFGYHPFGPNLRVLLLFFTCLVLSPANAFADTAPAIGTFKDWNDLDQVEIKQLFKLSDYATIIVQPFDTANIKLPAKEDNTFEPVQEAQAQFNALFLKKIQEEFSPIPVDATGKADKSNMLLVRGELIEIEPGSKAARYFAGFGAGHARVGIHCEIVDAKTGSVLAEMTHTRASSGGAFGGSYEKLLHNLTEEVGDDVVTLVKQFK